MDEDSVRNKLKGLIITELNLEGKSPDDIGDDAPLFGELKHHVAVAVAQAGDGRRSVVFEFLNAGKIESQKVTETETGTCSNQQHNGCGPDFPAPASRWARGGIGLRFDFFSPCCYTSMVTITLSWS